MLKKTGYILGVVLVAGALGVLLRNGTSPDVPPEVPATTVEKDVPAKPVIKEGPTEVETPVVAKAEPAEKKNPALDVKTLKAVDDTILRPVIREILSGDNYNDRLRSITYDMPEQLDAQEYQSLKNYLLTSQDGKDGDFRQHEYALRNYMMDALRGEKDQLSETIGAFSEVYKNQGQGEVMRNYALQHLSSVYIDNVSALSAIDKSRIIAVFTEALGDNSAESLAGNALIGLQDASRWDPQTVSPSTVGNAAIKFLQAENPNELAKISAFQIGGELKLKSVGPYAREIAFDEKADWMLRMSAVYALGQLGQTAGLNTLLDDSNKYVSRAVRMALKAQR